PRANADLTSLEVASTEFTRAPGVATALELVHASVAFDDRKSGLAAARYLEHALRRLPPELRTVLAWLSSPNSTEGDITVQPALVGDATTVEAAEVVRASRGRLINDPRNALNWLDAARAHTVLGNFGKAEEAMRRAAALSPNH